VLLTDHEATGDVLRGWLPLLPMAAPWARRTAVLGLAIATLVVVVLAAGGGSVEPADEGCCGWTWELWDDNADDASLEQILGGERAPEVIDEPLEGGDWLTLFARIAGVVIVAVLTYFLARFLWRTARAVRVEPLPEPADWEYASPTARDELTEAIETGLAELASGPVDETIIACWVRLEEAVATAGVERLPWETAAELATRALHDLHVPEVATRRLLTLYREARYSRHELPERARTEAADALREIRAALAPVGAT
jgi:hypothetical protein